MTREESYIDLILNKCLDLSKSSSLFISYYNYNEPLVQKILKKLENTHINDIYLECIDPFYEHDLIQKLSLKEIKKCKYFDASIYNTYALKNSAFLIIYSHVPDVNNDLDDEKLALVCKIKAKSKKIFIVKEITNQISWAIVPAYNEYWEKDLNINNLQDVLYDICQVDDNACQNWEEERKRSKSIIQKLNELEIASLHYTSQNGTDLTVGLPQKYVFEGIGTSKTLVNLPSYEVYTSPSKLLTNGTIYFTKPLLYNGKVIDDFYLEFKDGKVINFDAKKNKEILASIINFDENSAYLGEIALVDIDSPISKTNLIFKNTLLDENASCHVALGRGFSDKKNKEINYSGIHVDMMMGTNDLLVMATTKSGEKVKIMENCKFVI